MTSWEQALVIILSITLSIFLLVAIIALIMVIRILAHIKRVTAKAEAVVDKAGNVTTFFQNVAAPTALFGMVSNIFNSFRHAKAASKKGRHYEKRH